MSSILDALNKVEEDRNAQDDDADAPFVPEKAADALLGTSKKRRRSAQQSLSFNWKPLVYAAGGLIVIALIVGLSAGVALLIGKSSPPPTVVASTAKPATATPVPAVVKETYTLPAVEAKTSPAPPDTTAKPEAQPVPPPEAPPAPVSPAEARTSAPEPAASVVEPTVPPAPVPPVETKVPVPEPVTPEVEAPPPPKAAPRAEAKTPAPERVKPVPEKPAAKPAAAPGKVAKVLPTSAEEPTTPLPTFEAAERARSAASETKPSAPTPPHEPPTSLAPGRAAEKRAPLLEDINGLPRLGQAEREKLGLGEMRLNVLREASPSQPEGLAIINLKKVYVGEMIPGTNARLIAVKTRAVAIEIEGTGERFKVMN